MRIPPASKHEATREATAVAAADVTGSFPMAIDGSAFGWTAGADEAAGVLARFADAGGRLVCTADHYAGGRSEVMIGRWLGTLRDRSSVIVATKVGRHPDSPGLSARAIVRATEASLYRLATDYIDILSFDGEHPEMPIDESLEAVDMLRRAGKVRHLSASGYTGRRIAQVQGFAASAAYPVFRTAIAEYNLLKRNPFERDLAPTLLRLGIGGIARFPLAHGLLASEERGRLIHTEGRATEGAIDHVGRHSARVREAVRRVAEEHDVPLRCVALAWVMCQSEVSAVMVRASDIDQLDGQLAALRVRLTRHQLSTLNRVSA
ncbi:aryl-alcohol dehydrogenase-like predicted oxidoreductase [Marisediminicola sp. UYEF4]|uniref:aldo/keto reductase n=1 Tax=Marisediminicola sp. UYEF4 TaxID=1756384 RepID=UPI003391C652